MVQILNARSTLKRAVVAGAMVFASLALPASAQAAQEVSLCTNFTFNVTILSCSGGYAGNLLTSSLTDTAGLVAVGGANNGAFLEPKLEGLDSSSGIINFGTLLRGMTIFGMHAGGAGDGAQGTFFFRFDAGAGVDVVQITDRLNSDATGLSNAALFQTGTSAVPEPGTWAMMLMGFGALGASLRKRRRSGQGPLLQAA